MADDTSTDTQVDEPTAVENDDGTVTISREAWTNTTQAARAKEERRQEQAKIARENILLRAGVDPDSPTGKILSRVEGDLTVDEAKAFAAAQPTTPTAPIEGPELTAEERQSTTERQGLAAGARPDVDNTGEDPYKLAIAAARQDPSMTEEDRLGTAIGKIFESQDPRVLVPQEARYEP